jgi:hypothetical protein
MNFGLGGGADFSNLTAPIADLGQQATDLIGGLGDLQLGGGAQGSLGIMDANTGPDMTNIIGGA